MLGQRHIVAHSAKWPRQIFDLTNGRCRLAAGIALSTGLVWQLLFSFLFAVMLFFVSQKKNPALTLASDMFSAAWPSFGSLAPWPLHTPLYRSTSAPEAAAY